MTLLYYPTVALTAHPVQSHPAFTSFASTAILSTKHERDTSLFRITMGFHLEPGLEWVKGALARAGISLETSFLDGPFVWAAGRANRKAFFGIVSLTASAA